MRVSSIAWDLTDDSADEFMEEIKRSPIFEKYKPVIINVDSEHAEYIEFGTQKSSDNGTKGKKGPSKAYQNIRDWVEARERSHPTGLDTEAAKDKAAYAIYLQIMKEGIPPQPFIRPAIHEIERMYENGDFNENEITMEDIAETMIQLMIDFLEENHTIYDGGSIKDRISYEHVEFDDPRIADIDSFTDFDVSKEVWDTPYADRNGDTMRGLDRKYRAQNGELRW
jgi:hypothetical protein